MMSSARHCGAHLGVIEFRVQAPPVIVELLHSTPIHDYRSGSVLGFLTSLRLSLWSA